jgi:hypothetical protein
MAGEQPIIGGTAFLVSYDEGHWLGVTALHVILEIRARAPGSAIVLWMNRQGGGIESIESEPDDWITHPDTTQVVDAAVWKKPIPRAGWDHLPITREEFADDAFLAEYKLGIGDELFFPGLFVPHTGRTRLRPIFRLGSIAAMSEEPIQTKNMGRVDAYLGEVRSIGGLSGSPVWVYLDMWRPAFNEPGEAVPEAHSPALIGLVHGHYDATTLLSTPVDLEAVNMGISIIIPARKILEVIQQAEVEDVRNKAKTEREPASAVPDVAFTKVDFENALYMATDKVDPTPDQPAPEG